MKINWSYFLLCMISFLQFAHTACADKLTKRNAIDELKKSGFRYKQIELTTLDAESQTKMAESAMGLHTSFLSRELIGRVNQIQYGFSTPGDLNIFTMGASSIVAAQNLIDKSAIERIKAAKQNEDSTRYNRDQLKTDITYLTILQYLNAQRLQKKLLTSQANIERNQEIMKATEGKLNVGAGIQLDLMRVKNLVEFENLKKLEIENNLAKAKQDLASLIARENSEFDIDAIQHKKIDSNLLKEKERSDLLAAQSTVKAAQFLLEHHRKEGYPKLSLFGEIGVAGTHVVGGFGNAATGMVGLQLTVPLGDAGYRSAKEQETSVKLQQASLNEKQLNIEIKGQKETAKRQLDNAAKAVELSQKQVEASEEELKIVRKRFQAGASTSLELSNAQAGLAAAYDVNVESIFGYEIAKLNLYKALGNFEDYLQLEVEP